MRILYELSWLWETLVIALAVAAVCVVCACLLYTSGSYPKDICVFPDDRHIASINHENGSITFFSVDYKKGLLIMNGKEIRVNEPNSCVIVKVSD